jgi:polyisoprenyl-teichoic acid--peptidoglycan teichoic acid transferase
VNPAEMVGKYPQLARIARDNIYTDIPARSLPAFVDLVERVQKARVNSVTLTLDDGIKPWDPDYQRIRALVRRGIAAPQPARTPTTTGTSSPTTPAAAGVPGSTTTRPRTPATPSPTTTPYAQC